MTIMTNNRHHSKGSKYIHSLTESSTQFQLRILLAPSYRGGKKDTREVTSLKLKAPCGSKIHSLKYYSTSFPCVYMLLLFIAWITIIILQLTLEAGRQSKWLLPL